MTSLDQKSAFLPYLLLVLGLIVALRTWAQTTAPFNLSIEPLALNGLGGLQSYAFGEHNGKWLIVGGRLDGLHRRQPFAAFDVAGHNTQLIVVDLANGQKWTAPLSSLPTQVQEQLAATNMAFFQENTQLYIIGGYGYSASLGDHTTYGQLTAIDLPATIQAVMDGTAFNSHIRSVADLGFTVTGGRLGKLYDTYYLVGGQNFQGRYNPMGPTHGPGFFQEYTNSVRRFNIADNGTQLSIQHKAPWVDTLNLHRRDFNVVPQILPNGQEGLIAFSGVFQTAVDLPYLNCVWIDSSGYSVHPSFQQYYNHYHTATLPLYDAEQKAMHTVFFGGIAQFYDSLGILVQDNNVPFVKTIARVTVHPDNSMVEYKMPIDLPQYLGAGAEFIPATGVEMYPNGVIKMDNLADSTIIGYIYGGIQSTAPNIFWVNNGTQSAAYSGILAVRFLKTTVSGTHQAHPLSVGKLRLQAAPNPSNGQFELQFHLPLPEAVQIVLTDLNGKVLEKATLTGLDAGDHVYRFHQKDRPAKGIYLLNVQTPHEQAWLKVILIEE